MTPAAPPFRSALARTAIVVAVLLLAGCAVGPDFREPAAPAVARYTAQPLPAATAAAATADGDAQRFLAGHAVPQRWWTTFGNAELDRRVVAAFAHSPSIAAANAALTQAEESAKAAHSGLLPQLDGNAGVTRGKESGFQTRTGTGVGPYNLYNAGVSVGYVFDVFGGARRGVEAARAEADVARAQRDATYLALAGNVVTASLREASLREQISATRDIVASLQKELDITRKQQAFGAASLTDTLAMSSQLAATQATLPPLEAQLAAVRNQLATYLGVTPAQLEIQPVTLAAVTLPTDLPVALPSTLVAQRPDIRAASARLHVATADVGVATAAMLPRITLSASYTTESLAASALFGAGTGGWTLGANLLQPLFHFGQLTHQRRAAEAGRALAQANWQQTVLVAFQNVADALQALHYDADELKIASTAEADARKLLELNRVQFRAGATSYLNLLSAERQYQAARIAAIGARSARLTDTAALYAALGGGWNDSTAPVADTRAPTATASRHDR